MQVAQPAVVIEGSDDQVATGAVSIAKNKLLIAQPLFVIDSVEQLIESGILLIARSAYVIEAGYDCID